MDRCCARSGDTVATTHARAPACRRAAERGPECAASNNLMCGIDKRPPIEANKTIKTRHFKHAETEHESVRSPARPTENASAQTRLRTCSLDKVSSIGACQVSEKCRPATHTAAKHNTRMRTTQRLTCVWVRVCGAQRAQSKRMEQTQ